MSTTFQSFEHLSDQDLLATVARAVERERYATVELIAALIELDARRLYLGQGCSSLFTYCTQVLHLSEHAAFGRIRAARLAARFPITLNLLADGALNLTIVCLLAPHLTEANHEELLEAGRHKSKRDIEHLVARLAPKPDVKPMVRKLPEREQPAGEATTTPTSTPTRVTSTTTSETMAAEPLTVTPPGSSPGRSLPEVRELAPERFKIQFTVSRETHDKLRRAQDLLRHTIPNGDPGQIFARGLSLLIDELQKKRLGMTNRPRPYVAPTRHSRHIPAEVRRAVWKRDEGRCAFAGPAGRCTETAFLEFHHVVPYAAGGETSVGNLRLYCRPHNAHEAERDFGPRLALFPRDSSRA